MSKELGVIFLTLPIEILYRLESLIDNLTRSLFLLISYLELKDNHYLIPLILEDIEDKLQKHPLELLLVYLFMSNSLRSIHLNLPVEKN